jgi:hypothetical protein
MNDAIRKARATLERLDGIEDVFEADNARRDPYVPLRRELPHPRSTAVTQQPEPKWDDWNQWAEAHVQRGLERAAEIVGEEVGAIERSLIERIKKLEAEIGELRAEQTVEHAAKVVDLPSFLRKRDNAD